MKKNSSKYYRSGKKKQHVAFFFLATEFLISMIDSGCLDKPKLVETDKLVQSINDKMFDLMIKGFLKYLS